MSSRYETESRLLWLLPDAIIPSDIVSLCEAAMRRKMDCFIQHEVIDLTTFAKPGFFLGDLPSCKQEMHRRARDMDLSEHLMQTRMYFCVCGGDPSCVQTDLKTVSNCEDVDVLLSHMRHHRLPSNDKNQHVPCNESCEIQKPLVNVSNSSSDDLAECPFNSKTEILDLMQNQNAKYALYLPLTDEMCTALIRSLIEETRRFFAAVHRIIIESHRRDPHVYERPDGWASDWKSPAADWEAEHARMRDEFLARAGLQPPEVLRMIDIEATCTRQEERVVLVDYDAIVQQVGFTAISHTYGMPVYKAFDCPCASECPAKIRPRCSNNACPHKPHHHDTSTLEAAATGSEQQKRVVNDILRMCDILRKAGVKYAWHDGVCIAQHDDAEVEETIKHIGWIYAYAKDTVIFLHYVGSPMAPIRNSNDINELCCRWHTRVWTLQEGALSKCRRYCVRVGPLGDCQSMEEFEDKIALWYRDDSSTIEIMEEERFFDLVKEIRTVLASLLVNLAKKVLSIPDDADDDEIVESNWMWIKGSAWAECVTELLASLRGTCIEFPNVETALFICSNRDSKHRGDKMNSILALAGVKDFVAKKDVNVEASTIEFFERQGPLGLATAVFSINQNINITNKEYIIEEHQHTWPPILWSTMKVYEMADEARLEFQVLEDGRMELRAELICVEVQFTVDQHKSFVKTGGDTDELVLPYDLLCLDMDLTRRHMWSEFEASISECITGEVFISVIERFDSQTLVVSSEITDGDSFHTYLVIPIRMARHCLIVQGMLDGHVAKVGVFKPTQNFLRMVNVEHEVIIIEKLIIT